MALYRGDCTSHLNWLRRGLSPRLSTNVVSIFTFLGLWNDLFWPLIVLSDRIQLTLPVGLVVIQQGSYIQRGLAYAAAFIATMPPLVFYAVFQKRIIAGIVTTGMAGQ